MISVIFKREITLFKVISVIFKREITFVYLSVLQLRERP